MREATDHVTCQELVELVTDHMEAALTPDETALVEQHLNLCAGCASYLEQMRLTVRAVAATARVELPDHVRDALLTAFGDWNGEP
jgi:anti-sigma factor RsiW